MNVYIIGIHGWKGSGKTCLMTYLGYLDHKGGRKVYANYWTTYADYISLKEVSKLPDYLHDATVMLDEVHVGADARAIFKPSNNEINKLATQLRKRRVILMYTTQKWTYPDKRLREQAELELECKKPREKNPKYFRVIKRDRTIPTKRDRDALAEKFTFYGAPYFNMYDTDEVIDFEGNEDDIKEVNKNEDH